MGRNAARITHDEVVRMVKAVRACGMPIARVTFDGKRVDVIIGERESKMVDDPSDSDGLLAEPEL